MKKNYKKYKLCCNQWKKKIKKSENQILNNNIKYQSKNMFNLIFKIMK